MKTRFNILCALLAVAMIFGIAIDFATNRKAFSVSFNQGRESAAAFESSADGPMKVLDSKDMEWYYVNIVAKDYHIQTDSLYNHKTGRYEHAVLAEAAVRTDVKSDAEQKAYTLAGPICAITYIASIGYFWLMLIFCIIGVNRNEFFSEGLESRFTRMGICLIIAYVAQWTLEIFGYFWTRSHISLEHYDIVIDGPNCYFLCFGIGMIIVSELFKMARAYKEENEMTI